MSQYHRPFFFRIVCSVSRILRLRLGDPMIPLLATGCGGEDSDPPTVDVTGVWVGSNQFDLDNPGGQDINRIYGLAIP